VSDVGYRAICNFAICIEFWDDGLRQYYTKCDFVLILILSYQEVDVSQEPGNKRSHIIGRNLGMVTCTVPKLPTQGAGQVEDAPIFVVKHQNKHNRFPPAI